MPGLTSLALVCLLAGLVVGLLAGGLCAWPRLARPGARQVALRVLVLCAMQASLLSLIFVVVNRTNDFYSSWTDLLGRYRGGGTLVTLPEARARPGTLVAVLAGVPVSAPGGRPGGELQTVRFRGQLSGLTTTGHVYLPPGYPRSARPAGRYPAVIVISRSPAGGTSPYGARRLAAAAAAQIAAGRLRPVILVMLAPGPGRDPGCLDVPGGPQAAMFFGQDLPALVRSMYPASTGPGGWGLIGDVSGGYCALQLALTNAAAFAAAAVPPGSYHAPPGPVPLSLSPQFRTQDDLTWVVRHQPMQPISVLFAGLGRVPPWLARARLPMRVASAPLARGRSQLAPLLDWMGGMLNPGPPGS